MKHFNCNKMLQLCQEDFEKKEFFMKMVGLREIRKKRGLNQLKVAMDLSVSREAISLYETGKRSPDVEMLVRFSEYFDVSIDYLITGKEFSKK